MKTESERSQRVLKEQQFYQEFGSDDIFRFYTQLKAIAEICALLKPVTRKIVCFPTRLRSKRVKSLPEQS